MVESDHTTMLALVVLLAAAAASGAGAVKHKSSPPPPTKKFACAAGQSSAVCGALADLYHATSGPSWWNTAGWGSAATGTPTDLCTFNAVTCDASGTITALGPMFGLIGTLPASLGNLTTLSSLILHCNTLTGALPETLTKLTNLQTLSFYQVRGRGCVSAKCHC